MGTIQYGASTLCIVAVMGASVCRLGLRCPLSPPHVRAIEVIRSITAQPLESIRGTQALASFLSRCNLGLQSNSTLIDHLEL